VWAKMSEDVNLSFQLSVLSSQLLVFSRSENWAVRAVSGMKAAASGAKALA